MLAKTHPYYFEELVSIYENENLQNWPIKGIRIPAKKSSRTARHFFVLPGLDESVFSYQELLERLSEAYPHDHIVGIDNRGQGETLKATKVHLPLKLTIEGQVQVVIKILEKLQIEKAFFIALSYGGGVSLKLAEVYPERVNGLALIAPYVSKFKADREFPVGLGYQLAYLNPLFKELSFYSLYPYFQWARMRGALSKDIFWTPKRIDSLVRLTRGILDLNTDKIAANIRSLRDGVHLYLSADDPVVPKKSVQRLFDHLVKQDKKSLTIGPKGGHRLLAKHPEQVMKWIKTIV